MKRRVVVTNRVFPETARRLAAHAVVDANPREAPWPEAELRARCRDADGLMAFMTDRVDAAFLAACPRLRVIGAALKGYDNIDVDAATAAGVWVTIVPDLLTIPTAELAIGLMLALDRRIVEGDRRIRRDGFAGWRPALYGSGIAGTTVGLLGFGRVGQAIAQRLSGFGCRLVAHDAAAVPPPALGGSVTMMSRDRVLAAAEVLVLALPLTPATVHVIDADALARMRPGARLVNPARGSLVDEAAVADALEGGHLAGYAADVFECEDWARADRPRAVDPRLTAEGAPTVLTPHIGSAVVDIRREIELSAAAAIVDVIEGRIPRHAINDIRNDAQPRPRADLPRGA